MDLYLLLCREKRVSPERRSSLLQSVRDMKDRRALERRLALAERCLGGLPSWHGRAAALLLVGSALLVAGVRLLG